MKDAFLIALKSLLLGIFSSMLVTGTSLSAGPMTEESWAGQISDSLCGAKHEEAAEGQGKMADRDCTISCVHGGSKYVLVAGGKVFQISNQDFKDLQTHAGHNVKMTGEMKGTAITVSKIEMAQ